MKENIVDKKIELFLIGGDKIVIDYKIDNDIDDYISDEVRKCWLNKDFMWLEAEYDASATLGGNYVQEIDMSRVVAVNWM